MFFIDSLLYTNSVILFCYMRMRFSHFFIQLLLRYNFETLVQFKQICQIIKLILFFCTIVVDTTKTHWWRKYTMWPGSVGCRWQFRVMICLCTRRFNILKAYRFVISHYLHIQFLAVCRRKYRIDERHKEPTARRRLKRLIPDRVVRRPSQANVTKRYHSYFNWFN